jgi:E3 ubiquitin-protein ligase listerin
VDVYGGHWEELITTCINILAEKIPSSVKLGTSSHWTLSMLYETLQLHRSLTGLAKTEDCNEDLIETLEKSRESFYLALLELVHLERVAPDESHQPLRMVDELLQRMLTSIPETVPIQVEKLYRVLSPTNKSEALQLCAFQLLHHNVPKLQAQISVGVVLEKRIAKLPDELISLLLEAPSIKKDVLEQNLDEADLLTLKGYFLSWLLVFDHFSGAVSASPSRNQYH